MDSRFIINWSKLIHFIPYQIHHRPSHTVGAVAALRNIKNVISVARAVMEHTRHTMLVGDQATEFALAMGFKQENLTSKFSADLHSHWLKNNCQPNYWNPSTVAPDPTKFCGPYKPMIRHAPLNKIEKTQTRPEINRYNHDTIGVVTLDTAGRLASGTSTNGAKYKIPGRVGDSPITGAGSYVDQNVGGAAATGDGDIIMRYLVSYQTVEFIRQGMTPDQAAHHALSRILPRFPNASVAVVGLDVQSGEVGAACINVIGGFPYMVGKYDNSYLNVNNIKSNPEVEKKVIKCIN